MNAKRLLSPREEFRSFESLVTCQRKQICQIAGIVDGLFWLMERFAIQFRTNDVILNRSSNRQREKNNWNTMNDCTISFFRSILHFFFFFSISLDGKAPTKALRKLLETFVELSEPHKALHSSNFPTQLDLISLFYVHYPPTQSTAAYQINFSIKLKSVGGSIRVRFKDESLLRGVCIEWYD